MRTLKLTIAYDGTRYAGWQVQRGQRTVQGTLEAALRRLLQEPARIVASGRTDTGVHALAQAAHLKTRSRLPERRLLMSVNQLLPGDIAVMAIESAPARFHARFDARGKQYRYRIFTGPAVPPFIRPYVHHVRAPLNLAAMRRELRGLVGRNNFRAFSKTGRAPARRASQPGRAGRSTVRRVTRVSLVRAGDEIRLEIEGSGFLHLMVRSIAGTLIDVGRGRLPEGTVRRMLRRKDRRLAGTTAPGKGLALVRVTYGKGGA